MILWLLTIAISIALLAITAFARSEEIEMAYANIAVAAVAGLIFVALALNSIRQLQVRGASRLAVAADTARSMSFIYFWGTLGLVAVYGTGILTWKEWWHFLLAFLAVGVICFAMSLIMQSKVKSGEEDTKLLTVGNYGNIVQLVGMIAIMVGLLIDGKMVRFIDPRAGWEDWGANNIFFFGAAALAIVSLRALLIKKQPQ